MKSALVTLIIAASIAIFSCQSAEKSGDQPTTQTAAEELSTDAIIRDTITNNQGVKLAMAYDNANRTATFRLSGEEIKLKQDSSASGIKYSNAEYEYTEHQGQMTLKKDGNVIFSYKQ